MPLFLCSAVLLTRLRQFNVNTMYAYLGMETSKETPFDFHKTKTSEVHDMIILKFKVFFYVFDLNMLVITVSIGRKGQSKQSV